MFNRLAMGLLFAVAACFFAGGLYVGTNESMALGAVLGVLFCVLGWACRPYDGNEDAVHGSEDAIIKSCVFRLSECALEMQVEAGHSKIVEDDLDLPEGTWIEAIKRNRLYRVLAPVRIPGNEVSESGVYETAVELARQIGWAGKVKRS